MCGIFYVYAEEEWNKKYIGKASCVRIVVVA